MTYGPINIHTTMFESYKKGHPDYVAVKLTKKSKTIYREDVPHPIQYPKFFGEEWDVVTKQQKRHKRKMNRTQHDHENRMAKRKRPIHGLPHRQAIKIATPLWTTKQDYSMIKKVYKKAKELSEAWGEKIRVDHIIPLRGETVCGLHVFDNLQVMAKDLNTQKGNAVVVIL